MGRAPAVLVIVLLLGLGALAPMSGSDGGDASNRNNELYGEDYPVWTDPLDDLSRVYQTVGVEVTGGEAHLASGETKGWIASSIISPPEGSRYDLVILDVETPGNSFVELSMLDASMDTSEVGFANETIPGFKLLEVDPEEPIVSVHGIEWQTYPEVRVQITFHANGSASPRLLSWSLHFIGLDEWCDEFLSAGKMSEHGRINFTDDALEIDLSFGRFGGEASYEPYPTLAARALAGVATLHYPNAANDGYQNAVSLTDSNGDWLFFSDIDGDGIQDLILSGQYQCRYYLADASGTYTYSSYVELSSASWGDVTSGDYNNDGWADLIFRNTVFLNEADGTIDDHVDITLSGVGSYIETGNINGDDFDDMVTVGYSGGNYALLVYYGNSNGLNETSDVEIVLNQAFHVIIDVEDLDGDGYDDIIVKASGTSVNEYKIFISDGTDLDSTPNYTLTVNITEYILDLYGGTGDLNGDGFFDIVALARNRTSLKSELLIYEGASDGWKSTRYHSFQHDDIGYYGLLVLDIDTDGFDDIVTSIGSSGSTLAIAFGGTEFPTQWNITKTGGGARLAAAVGRGSYEARTYRGGFTTEPITLPPGKRWDLLNIDGEFPEDTFISIDVLGPSDEVIDGYEGLSNPCVDLSDLGPGHSTIKVKIVIHSYLSTATPILDSIRVKWIDPMTWRDEFYGNFKIDDMLNLDVMDAHLQPSTTASPSPQLVFTSVRGDEGYDTTPQVFFDAGDLDYLPREPTGFRTWGTSAADLGDIDGDGNRDIVFAVHSTKLGYSTASPLFRGTPTGFLGEPSHTFQTTGASDVLLRDIDDDGIMDVVFAQEQDGTTYNVDSALFWGTASGWNDTPDVEFSTTGASDVDMVDIDDDGRLDLVFACYRDDSGTSVDSMVFLQDATGFCGTVPSHHLATRGARAVAAGDIDGDGHVDLVFANSMSGGVSEIDSYIYWGAEDGFDPTPAGLGTVGATDVQVADLDSDGDLDLVFANHVSSAQDYHVDSYVFLNDGSGGFDTEPGPRLPTVGASAVAVADLDGTGWKDLVFACEYNGTNYSVPSRVYLGGMSGWSSSPDILLPTEGASSVLATYIFDAGHGGYISEFITPDPADDPGTFHTLRYTANIGTSQKGTIQLVDATTKEVLAETVITSGTHEQPLEGLFYLMEHPSIQVVIIGEGLDQPGAFSIYEVWLNWTKRVHMHPEVQGITVSEPSVYRLQTVRLSVNVTDEYDLPEELTLTAQHRLNGTEDWYWGLLGAKTFNDGVWSMDISPRVDTAVGSYDLRVLVRDSDHLESGWVEFPNILEVLNNVPTTPEIRLLPARPDTTSTLSVEFVRGAQDVEGTPLTYAYLWYLDGELQPLQVTDTVDPSLTERGQNWSVRVSASDGEDEGPAATAWLVIQNALPRTAMDLPDPSFEEDTTDSDWLDLSTAFEDPDGDTLAWSVETPPIHLTVDIDPVTGKVTLTPEENWNGQEDITFIASDGEDSVSQSVTVYVTAVNDVPWFATVNGEPVGEGPVEMTIKQGGLLSIDVLVVDPEGDELVFDVNTTLFQVDGSTGAIRWQPDNDQVGKLRFAMTVWDVVTPSRKVTLDFIVTVENENDPMDDPRIIAPSDGVRFEEGILFSLIATCTDPDTRYGQVLNFSWSSNMSGHLGYGPSLNIALDDIGTHVITLTVTDGEFQRSATVTVVIKAKAVVGPLPDGDGGTEEPFNYALVAGIVVAIVVIGVLFFVARTRKRAEELETADEEEYKREHMERAYEAVKAAADRMEAERGETAEVASELEAEWVESRDEGLLTMEARETEAASAQTMALFGGAAAEPIMSEEESEQLRLDNLKRKYQNAIGRLPYGIPSPELREWDWVDLASALATGEKQTLPDGAEVTEIDGRWYHSDADDTGTFLKEHGARKEEPKKAEAAPADKTALLAKLEERFILGEISEEAYMRLVEKYSEEE